MNIIVVDDERLALESLLNTISLVLTEATINGFRNPDEAIAHLHENICHVAFLDIKLRGMTGIELAKRIKNIHKDCNIIFVTGYSNYTMDAFRLYASDYLMKPATPESVKQALDHLRTPIFSHHTKRVFIQCFGNFEVFVNKKAIVFSRQKAKELLAYLVDKKGSFVTMGELLAVLWPEEANTKSRQSNLRNLISNLKHTLAAVNAEHIILKRHNAIALDCESVDCDYYDFLYNIPYAVNSYQGQYMAQYSWGEITTASLPLTNFE